MDIQTRSEKELVWVQILYLYILPILLLYYKIIPGNMRLFMLFSITLVQLGIIHRAKWTFRDVGIFGDFLKDWKVYTLFTLCGVLFLYYFNYIFPHEPFDGWYKNTKFLLFFIPISIVQEVVFRGVLMNMLKKAFNNKFFIILLNASIFALIHIIYLHASFILPLTFIGGIAFSWIYYKYPNLILVSISHCILNFMAMILGFFTLR